MRRVHKPDSAAGTGHLTSHARIQQVPGDIPPTPNALARFKTVQGPQTQIAGQPIVPTVEAPERSQNSRVLQRQRSVTAKHAVGSGFPISKQAISST